MKCGVDIPEVAAVDAGQFNAYASEISLSSQTAIGGATVQDSCRNTPKAHDPAFCE